MQRFPSGGPPKLKKSTVMKVIGILLVLGLITYFINLQFGSYYSWVFAFFIAMNAYFGWRAYRRSVSEYQQDQKQTYQMNTKEYFTDENTSPEDQQKRWKAIENQYKKCDSCGAELIPGLSYCEECGTSV